TNWHQAATSAKLASHLQRFPFAPCLFHHFFISATNPNPVSNMPPTNYSFKVVFRDFRVFHSVPVKTTLCSNWNIEAIVPAEARSPKAKPVSPSTPPAGTH